VRLTTSWRPHLSRDEGELTIIVLHFLLRLCKDITNILEVVCYCCSMRVSKIAGPSSCDFNLKMMQVFQFFGGCQFIKDVKVFNIVCRFSIFGVLIRYAIWVIYLKINREIGRASIANNSHNN
jgi:hypothetical protein